MIRFAKTKDISRIGELLEQVNLIHYNGRPDIFKKGKKYTDQQVLELINNPSTPILVYTDDNDFLLGYAFLELIQHKDSNLLTDILTLYIDDLCVDQKVRGQGVGKALYNEVLKFAKEKGCYNVTLNVWSCNQSAYNFYIKQGLVTQKIVLEKIL